MFSIFSILHFIFNTCYGFKLHWLNGCILIGPVKLVGGATLIWAGMSIVGLDRVCG